MTVLAIANAAGSAGKTTTAVTLATLIAQSGFTCDLIDFDPQGNATHWTGVTVTPDTPTIADVLNGNANLVTARLATAIPGLSVLPATSAGMEGVEARLSRVLGAEQLLRLALEAAGQPADHTIIDCPGTWAS